MLNLSIETVEFMFLISMFWARLRLILAQSFWVSVKMSSEKGPKYIYAQDNKLYYYCHFGGRRKEGVEKINRKKKAAKLPEEYFFH